MNQMIIGGIFLTIIGLLLLIDPHGFWKVAERWKLLGTAEASPAFVTVARILGAIVTIIGVLVAFGVLK